MIDRKINIGVDIGGTTINVGLVHSEEKKILANSKIPTDPARGKDAIVQSIIEAIQLILQDNELSINEVRSIGIGIPGTVDSKKGLVVFAPNLFWENVEIRSSFEKVFNTPVYLGQDSRAAVWGEFLVGSGKRYKNIAGITLGTGIGCGMIINGNLFHGGLNTAGEFGHQLVETDGYLCNCGRRGCLETYAAGLAIVRKGIKITEVTVLLEKSKDEITVEDIYHLAKNGNTEALRITKEVVNYLGIGIVNLINLNSLELICISGGISNAPDELLFNPLKEFIQARAYSAIANDVVIVKSILGDNAPMVGAALLCQATEFEKFDSFPDNQM